MRTILVLSAAAALTVCGTVAFAVDYTWNASVDGDWQVAGNWSPAGGPPSGAGDAAIFDDTSDDNCDSGIALTIGTVELQYSGGVGYDGTLTLGGNMTVDTLLKSKKGTIDTSASSYNLTVDGSVIIDDGKLICNSSTVIFNGSSSLGGGPGLLSAPDASGSLELNGNCDWRGGGTFTHNDGTVFLKHPAHTYYRVGGDYIVFNNIVVKPPGGLDSRFYGRFTILGTLSVTNANGYIQLYAQAGAVSRHTVLTLGDATHQGKIDFTAPLFRIRNTAGDEPVLITGHPSNRGLIVGGKNWDWDGNVFAGKDVKIAYLDFDHHVNIENQYVTMTNDCEFKGFTIGAAGSNRIDSGTMTVEGSFTNNGTFVAGTSTVIFTNVNATVDGGNDSFYNLTTAAGSGKTVTLVDVSGIANLTVLSGSCATADKISTTAISGLGTWNTVDGGVDTIALDADPAVALNAVLETGNPPPAGTVIIVR